MPDLSPALAALVSDPGGAVCVMRDGVVVAEAWGGTVDGVRPWTPDTLVMSYSVAKPLAALAVLSVVAEGRLGLDDAVASVWPSYDVGGKGATTVRQVLAHQAGLACFPAEAAEVAYDDRDALEALLAAAVPAHVPGEAVGEHALTYGHLCDRIVRGATGEDLAERFGRLAAGAGWDLHLRVSAADLGRCADVVTVGPDWPAGYLSDPRWGPALGRPAGLLDPDVLNSERWRRTSFAAISLHASARGLACFYDDLLSPDGFVARLLGDELHAAYVGPAASGHDLVLDRSVTWTLGFQRSEEELGMGGAGGCAGWWSFGGRYAAGHVTRGLGDESGVAVWDLLEAALPVG